MNLYEQVKANARILTKSEAKNYLYYENIIIPVYNEVIQAIFFSNDRYYRRWRQRGALDQHWKCEVIKLPYHYGKYDGLRGVIENIDCYLHTFFMNYKLVEHEDDLDDLISAFK
ncbi:hypothetical protein [Ralstonia phage RP13]|nr:hypothetical protein [Ralstonia phage RP13]BCG50286.1 hypothetical protein [Ralstonia phage RP13]